MRSSSRVAVTGIGVATPLGCDLESLQAGLMECRNCLEPSRAFDVGFAPTVAQVRSPLGVESRPGFRLSRTDELAIYAARAAAQAAGRRVGVAECGVAVSTTVAGLGRVDPRISADPRACYRKGGFSTLTSYQNGHVADAVGAWLGLRGPRLGVTVACASGAMAIALAARMILDGRAEAMIAGGSDSLCEFTIGGFHSLQALDPEPCRPFDLSRNGLNLGEGAAMLVLEDLERARARKANVWAVLRGWAMTNDAFHLTAPHEAGRGLAESLAGATRMAGAGPDEIGYVNAHGTATFANDVAETKAYELAFGARREPIPVSSTKSYIGHLLAAAGAVEAVITILSLQKGVLFPTLRLRDPISSPAVDWLRDGPRAAQLNLAMTASAGFGGSNTSLLFGLDE